MTARTALLGLAVFASLGCDEPTACEEVGAARCADDATLELCSRAGEQTDARWIRGACPEGTPTCVEHGPAAAACVSEDLGPCELDTFEDRCVGDGILEDCVRTRSGAARQRLRCDEGERCVAAPRDALDEERPPLARYGCFAPRPEHEPPALVTLWTGDVTLDGRAPPPPPFRVRPGQRLTLGPAARVVVLVKERPSRVSGPTELDPYVLQPARPAPTREARALLETLAEPPPRPLSPDEPLLEPTPTAGGVVRLVVGEGVPGASSTLRRIAWRCDQGACGRTVELRQTVPQARMLWRGNGERALPYDGPELEPGSTYELTLGQQRYRVETLPPIAMGELLAATADWEPAERLSVIAAVHLLRGSRAAAVEALARGAVDRPRDRALRGLLESLRGQPASSSSSPSSSVGSARGSGPTSR